MNIPFKMECLCMSQTLWIEWIICTRSVFFFSLPWDYFFPVKKKMFLKKVAFYPWTHSHLKKVPQIWGENGAELGFSL